MRSFFRFGFKRKWIAENPADDLKPPKAAPHPTLPYTQPEMQKILAAVDLYAKRAGVPNAQLLLAFVLLLRYSGMRIGDTVQCGPDRITGNKLFLYTQKTGTPVYCVLPDAVIDALEKAPKRSEKYFFWTGESKLHSIVGKWQRRLKSLFDLAKIKGGHAHRFRDTFAVELLLSGVLLERVSILLGHSSVRITERSYAPWVRSRQEQLENDVQNAWKSDPVLRDPYLTSLEPKKPSNGKVHKRYTDESGAANDEESDDWNGRGGGGRTHDQRLKRPANSPRATN
jgi:integrase/recombinase XerD